MIFGHTGSNIANDKFSVTMDDIVSSVNVIEEYRERELKRVTSEMEDIALLVLSAGVNRSDIKVAVHRGDHSTFLQIGNHYERI